MEHINLKKNLTKNNEGKYLLRFRTDIMLDYYLLLIYANNSNVNNERDEPASKGGNTQCTRFKAPSINLSLFRLLIYYACIGT